MTQVVQARQTDTPMQSVVDRLVGIRLLVTWSCLLPPPEARGEEEQAKTVHTNGQARSASFTIALKMLDDSRGVLTSQIEQPGQEPQVISDHAVDMQIHGEGDLRQILATVEGEPRLLLVLDSEDRLVYVQSPLPEEGGVLGGRYDPPSLQILSPGD